MPEKYLVYARKMPASCQDYCFLLPYSPRYTDRVGRDHRQAGAAPEGPPPCLRPGAFPTSSFSMALCQEPECGDTSFADLPVPERKQLLGNLNRKDFVSITRSSYHGM